MYISDEIKGAVYRANHKRPRVHSKRVKYAYSQGVKIADKYIPKGAIYGRDINGEYYYITDKIALKMGRCPIVMRFNGVKWYKTTDTPENRDLLDAVVKFMIQLPAKYWQVRCYSAKACKDAESVSRRISDCTRKFKRGGMHQHTCHTHGKLQIKLDVWENCAPAGYGYINGTRESAAIME